MKIFGEMGRGLRTNRLDFGDYPGQERGPGVFKNRSLIICLLRRDAFTCVGWQVTLCDQWRFYVGARGAQAPQILPRPLQFFGHSIVLLLVELIGSIVNFA